MGIFDIFKSKKTIARERNREEKRAIRGARRSSQEMEALIAKLTRQRDAAYQKAVAAKREGKALELDRYKREFRTIEMRMAQLTKQAGVWNDKIVSLEAAGAAAGMSRAVKSAADTLIDHGVDADAVADALDTANEVSDSVSEIDAMMDGEITADESRMSGTVSDAELDAMIDADAAGGLSSSADTAVPSDEEIARMRAKIDSLTGTVKS